MNAETKTGWRVLGGLGRDWPTWNRAFTMGLLEQRVKGKGKQNVEVFKCQAEECTHSVLFQDTYSSGGA